MTSDLETAGTGHPAPPFGSSGRSAGPANDDDPLVSATAASSNT
jgi:hypothetical protein